MIYNLTGKRFGKLVVQSQLPGKGKNSLWQCKCDCGNTTITTLCHLRSGHTKSCGCLRSETNRIHGESDSKLYGVWKAMRSRCNKVSDSAYKNYGGRGIAVYPDWNKSFLSFSCWAHKTGYAIGLCLDRKNNNDSYTPQNCRWTTYEIQQNNKRTNVLITINDRELSHTQWCRLFGINPNTLKYRQSHWNKDRWLKQPNYCRR